MYPARCPLCDRVLKMGQIQTCPECLERLQYPQGNLCCRCGKPIEETEMFCKNCEEREYTYISGRAAALYNGVMQESVARFKYGGRQEYGAFYGELLWRREGDWIQKIQPDLLVPVPLHPARYRKRGYNQAQILAEQLAGYADVPVADGLLVRKKKTLPQKDLSWRERMQNLQHAFQMDVGVRRLYAYAKCAIIIDDIYTTGSTIEACSRVLGEAGFDRIYFLSLCIGKDS